MTVRKVNKMDKLLAVLCLVIAVAIIVVFDIYLRMDKNRSMALVMLKEMREDMDRWLSVSDLLFEHCQSCPQYSEYAALTSDFHAVSKRHIAEKVPMLNKIYSIVKSVISDNCSNSEVIATGHKLTDVFLEFSDLQMEYNSLVIKLNRAFESKISGTIGRISRLKPMERLKDLSVL